MVSATENLRIHFQFMVLLPQHNKEIIRRAEFSVEFILLVLWNFFFPLS